MSEEKVHNLDFTEDELVLFNQWLIDRQQQLLNQLTTVKSLIEKVDSNIKKEIPGTRNPQWAHKCLRTLKHYKRRMDSTEIVNVLIGADALSSTLPRVEVMRGVSSRLNQLVNRGQVKKEVIDGKFYYSYLKEKD